MCMLPRAVLSSAYKIIFLCVHTCTCVHACGGPRTSGVVLWVLSPLFAVTLSHLLAWSLPSKLGWPQLVSGATCMQLPIMGLSSAQLRTWDLGVELTQQSWSSHSRQGTIGHPRLHLAFMRQALGLPSPCFVLFEIQVLLCSSDRPPTHGGSLALSLSNVGVQI